MRDDEVWGICNVCKSPVLYGDRFTHPCPNYYVDYSWNALANPTNTPGLPGYKFHVEQESGARTGHKCRGNHHRKSRTYAVHFEIDPEGRVRHTGGPKPTDELLEQVEEMCARDRPGSNWYPGATDD